MSPSAFAEATAREFLEEHAQASEDGQRYLVGFLAGVLAGYGWANVSLKTGKEDPLFCLTARGETESEEPIKLLKLAIAQDLSAADLPVGAVLLSNLGRRYPCAKPKVEKGPTYTPPGL